ncbi:Putative, 10TM heavy-metal exporter [Dethiosulfatibacter aminovorans DSM 17477]|uniref:Putative, 10TM heavy-metal exporter n=1 Tax=Dethiosulfatibacter aminovorans DSM 17477 TaxID=1121476 RepID=A0A1M6L252_9FIRM|nr:putative manganese transporter [Dethiosulfatibacter aminovorans]SHJ65365.1 Putative, 10TM heavy-metal exporter [Dethiosulfatibacter aminovorans DSM 17477]
MKTDILEIILTSAEEAFLEVAVFVGCVLLIMAFINYKKHDEPLVSIEKTMKFQPVIGAFIGLIPGCGGVIFLVPLFFKGTVSFGAIIAALIATTGDAAFVLISTVPLQFVVVSFVALVTAIATGYLVDNSRIGEMLLKRYVERKIPPDELAELHRKATHTISYSELKKKQIDHIGHEEGDEMDIVLHHKSKGHEKYGTLSYRFTHGSFAIYWTIMLIGLIMGILLMFQVDIDKALFEGAGRITGSVGIVFSIVVMVLSKKIIKAQSHEETELKSLSLREAFIHSAEETAFITTWVFVAFMISSLVMFRIGHGNIAEGEEILKSMISSAGPGIAAVVLGAVIGLIPGCGPQIIFVSLYLKGMIPFAALLANALSQDGDGLFPMLAIDLRSSFWASLITTLPALIMGLVFYLLEFTI